MDVMSSGRTFPDNDTTYITNIRRNLLEPDAIYGSYIPIEDDPSSYTGCGILLVAEWLEVLTPLLV